MPRNIQYEIGKLKKMILRLSSLVEGSLEKASASVLRVSKIEAEQVVENDKEIDAMEITVEEECLKLLALHQPVATDLRYIITVLKINDELERIGDLSVNIAERTLSLFECEKINLGFDFKLMTQKVIAMLKKSVNALIDSDEVSAYEVLYMDNEIDQMHSEIYDKVQHVASDKPDSIRIALHYLSISKHLERIADHAESIAENIIYMIGGEIIRHHHSEE